MQTLDAKVQEFLAQKPNAVAGVSRDNSRPQIGNLIYHRLKTTGHDVFPVNPHMETFERDRCYRTFRPSPAASTALWSSPGPTLPAAIKNFLLTIAMSRGVPMLLAGDEFRRTQRGNNAYYQDNEMSWIDWSLFQRPETLLPIHGLRRPARPTCQPARALARRFREATLVLRSAD